MLLKLEYSTYFKLTSYDNISSFVGLLSVEVLSGEARLMVNISGIDFMHILPKINSILKSVETHKIRPKGAMT